MHRDLAFDKLVGIGYVHYKNDNGYMLRVYIVDVIVKLYSKRKTTYFS